ncbi:sialate O-acetylesterase [uncultured Draconibacterium sp.]|uniref:sialate O-acetylesterase n=1 Tax=uncultured Draconibacterium sp. TaxID=1573823 RepID=UPI00325FF6BC
MKKILSLFFVVFLSLQLVTSAYAEVKLPAIISSNMVLQRNTEVPLWGWADAEEEITIQASWLTEVVKTKADESGSWIIQVRTTTSKEAQTIRITSENADIKLQNILFGEVWLCSGQSNMEQPMAGYGVDQPTFESLKTIARAHNKNIRLFSVERNGSKTPLNDVEKYRPWEESNPDNVLKFSALAYFFGQQLQEILDVPVGIIHTSWGGSDIKPWISKEVMNTFEKVDIADADLSHRTNHIPTVLFNAMIHPLIPYRIKGALWYQGESNRKEPEEYTNLFPAMVNDWRTRWKIGEFPFYFVQIAPYYYNNYDAFQSVENTAFMREAQLQCAQLIPNSGMAVLLDIGAEKCIHPPKKKEAAERLLYHALNKTYGFKSLDCESPVYESMEIKDGGIELGFKHAETGIYSFGELEGFEIAGKDKVFYPAKAEIVFKKKKVFVKSDKVTEPLAVRYAWGNWVVGTLFDVNLLPASSFRTDNWDDATRFGN